jgi:hypothetical protein
MSSWGSVYAWCGCREPGGGWVPGARGVAGPGMVAGICRWNCLPGLAVGAAGSAAAGFRRGPPLSRRWRVCGCRFPAWPAACR